MEGKEIKNKEIKKKEIFITVTAVASLITAGIVGYNLGQNKMANDLIDAVNTADKINNGVMVTLRPLFKSNETEIFIKKW